MSKYAQNLARQAKLLNPSMKDHEIICCVKRHFSIEIAREIRPGTVTSLYDLTGLLDEIEKEQRIFRTKEFTKLAKKTR